MWPLKTHHIFLLRLIFLLSILYTFCFQFPLFQQPPLKVYQCPLTNFLLCWWSWTSTSFAERYLNFTSNILLLMLFLFLIYPLTILLLHLLYPLCLSLVPIVLHYWVLHRKVLWMKKRLPYIRIKHGSCLVRLLTTGYWLSLGACN